MYVQKSNGYTIIRCTTILISITKCPLLFSLTSKPYARAQYGKLGLVLGLIVILVFQSKGPYFLLLGTTRTVLSQSVPEIPVGLQEKINRCIYRHQKSSYH